MKKLCIALSLVLLCEAPVLAQTAAKKKTTKKATPARKRTPATAKRTYYYTPPAQARVEDGKERPNPYVDPNSPTHDGKEKNINRNINYGSGQDVPPNDGGNVPANNR